MINWKRYTPQEKQSALDSLLKDPDVIPQSKPRPELVGLENTLEAALKRLAVGDNPIGVLSGYASLDKLTKGFDEGELVVVFGHTSHGKSQLAQNIAVNVARRGEGVLMISLEMTKAENTGRLIRISGFAPDDPEEVIKVFMEMPIYYPKANEIKAEDIDSLVQVAVQQYGVKMVMIDHLHYFSRSIEFSTEEVGRLVNDFKKTAVKHTVPILLISHIVKAPEESRPGIVHLRGSSFIGQDADQLISVWRDREEDIPELVVTILKNRNRGFDPAHNTIKLLVQDHVKLIESLVF